MANTTIPSNKREPTVFDIKRPRSSNSVRRWLHILKHAAFKNHENDADSLKTKPSHDSAPCTPEPSPTEGESEDPQAEIEEPKEPTRSYFSSFTTPRSGPTPTTTTTTTTSSEPLHQTLTSVPENSASSNTTEAVPPSSSPSVVPVKKKPTTRPTASKPRHPRKPTMITPELMQQIQTSNRKHSSSPLLNASELPTRASGTAAATATATNRAKEVLASPLRWSEQ